MRVVLIDRDKIKVFDRIDLARKSSAGKIFNVRPASLFALDFFKEAAAIADP